MNGATCVSTKTESGIDYACHCPAKYSGAHCETFNPSSCEDIECKNGGTCQMNNGIPICKWVNNVFFFFLFILPIITIISENFNYD